MRKPILDIDGTSFSCFIKQRNIYAVEFYRSVRSIVSFSDLLCIILLTDKLAPEMKRIRCSESVDFYFIKKSNDR
jgi:hypothetical protein